MKLRLLHLFAAVLALLCALPSEALIVLGGDEGHTNAPPDDPGWDNIGYVRSMWNQNRASGVYLGDGWVLTSYHVIYYDAPTGIVFNAESDKAYPIDVSSYVRLDTNSLVRLAELSNWNDYGENYLSLTNALEAWKGVRADPALQGADLALFRLTENPDIHPVHITELSKNNVPIWLSWFGNEVTAISTGRPRMDERSSWTTNLTDWVVETDGPLTNAPYSGYYDWPDVTYDPICRWGKNKLYSTRTPVTRAPFGSTICLPTVFNDYGNGGTNDTFQMARLDSGGGVFYKGTGKWKLLGLLTAKKLPNESVYSTDDRTIHPFGSYSMICDLSYYREQITQATRRPDLSIQLSAGTNTWLEIGQQIEISVITANSSTNAVLEPFSNTLQFILNGQTNETVHVAVSSLTVGTSVTNTYNFIPDSPGTWNIIATADSNDQIFETHKQNNQASKTFYIGPDLRITRSSPSVTNAVAGSQVSFQISAENQGNADALDSFEIALYCYTNDLFTTLSESELANLKPDSVTTTGLATDNSLTNSLSATVPAETGTYYLRARIDGSNTVAEAVEYNNWGPPCEIRVGPDLIIANSSPTTTNAVAGAPVSIELTVKNLGSDINDDFKTALFILYPTTKTQSLEWDSSLPGIPANTSTTLVATINAPTNIGYYYLVAMADNEEVITEANTNNNTGWTLNAYTVLYVGPDLMSSFSETNALHATARTTVGTVADISNNGSGSSISIETVLQLSTNLAFTTFSAVATNTVTDSGSEQFEFKAPSKPGTYYLRVQTDPLNLIPEFNENNNFSDVLMLNVTPLAMPWLNLLLN